MKVIEKISLIIFSYIVIILAVIACLSVFGWIDVDYISDLVKTAFADPTATKVILAVSIVLILLAIRCIFFSGSKEEAERRDGILLENEGGKLVISKETLETLISSVAKSFEGAENVTSKVTLDKEHNLIVYVSMLVHPDAVIKDLSSNLQTKIKETIKNTSDLDVKEVNVRIKNIAPEKENLEE